MKRVSTYILLALLLLLQSCIKEDSSPTCESWLLLRFRYTLNDQYTNLFYPAVGKITVYVFDSQGKYVDRFSEQGDLLTNDYVMRIPLPEGKYSVIAYGGNFTTYTTGELNRQNNMLNSTLRQGITDISNFRAELKNTAGAENYLYATTIPDDLFAGFTASAVAEINNQKITDIELIKDTKNVKVKITVAGLSENTQNIKTGAISAGAEAPLFNVYITAQNGRYLFDNSTDPNHGIFKYIPLKTTQQTNYMEADLKIMRLLLGQSPMLVIKNNQTSEILYNENMIKQIALTSQYVTQKDFDREDQFVFEISLQSKESNIGVEVTINGWQINNTIPDIE